MTEQVRHSGLKVLVIAGTAPPGLRTHSQKVLVIASGEYTPTQHGGGPSNASQQNTSCGFLFGGF